MAHQIGDRVRTLVDTPAGWPGAPSFPAGTAGTVTGLPIAPGTAYGVVLDGDLDRLPADYEPGELTAAG